MKTILNLFLVVAMFGLTLAVRAQDEVPPPMPDQSVPTFSAAQLDQLTGPVALYPDPLIAVLLPAATLPTQIVMADRYIQNGGDPSQMDPSSFDPNIIALAHYPAVLTWMDNNLNWTTQLGEAFAGQQQDVMDSVQRLRLQAYNLGNLVSTPQQTVVDDNGYIEILPANPNDIYVPDYRPTQVYYQQPYGAPYITFSVGFPIGLWLCGDFDWHNHHLIVWDRDHPRPRNWWHEQPQQRTLYISRQTTTWQPQNHAAFQPQGDRGWNNQGSPQWVPPGANNHNFVPPGANNHNFTPPGANNHNVTPSRPDNAPRSTPPVMTRPTPAPTPSEHYEPTPQRPQNDTFIGIQNPNDARNYSNRGQQSMDTTTHNESSSHESSGGGGGGGSHSSGGGGGSSGGGGSHSGGGGGGGGGGNQRH